MKQAIHLLALVFCAAPSPVVAESGARVAFEQLKGLAGDWRSEKQGNATVVNYAVIANGTTVVENWTMSPTLRSMTVYTLDGDRLIATHYCPQGNAPRLQWMRTDADGTHRFEFVDGANLQDPSGSHEHAFRMRIDASGTLRRSEVYIRNDAAYDAQRDVGDTASFVRVPDA
ncbi:MAG TPA: hypothetical protein VLF18_06455 [Tahibacter sp.]|uniref:hypothetical protein n=1 Tax=Tahibacter sp. TaxID=2056211 RepID=UPI002BA05496|nr:hypothetical protein [Tahibacter sp.]HSX59822.1 hypothetical protein [Tahibacter sp.]